MKYYFILGCLFLFSNLTFAQEAAFDVAVKNAAGEVVNFQDMVQDGRPKVVVFWATFCAGCKLEMKAINFFDQKWNDEFGADVLAISIDAPGNFEKANQLLADKGYTGYEAYFDDSLSLYKALDGELIPLTLLLDGRGNIYKRWNVYDDGLESSIDIYLSKLVAKNAQTSYQQ